MRSFDIDLPPIVDPHQNLAPLRSAIGVMEQWNNGFWTNVDTTFFVE